MPKIIKIKIKKETLKRILRRVNGGMEGRMDGRVGDLGKALSIVPRGLRDNPHPPPLDSPLFIYRM